MLPLLQVMLVLRELETLHETHSILFANKTSVESKKTLYLKLKVV